MLVNELEKKIDTFLEGFGNFKIDIDQRLSNIENDISIIKEDIREIKDDNKRTNNIANLALNHAAQNRLDIADLKNS